MADLSRNCKGFRTRESVHARVTESHAQGTGVGRYIRSRPSRVRSVFLLIYGFRTRSPKPRCNSKITMAWIEYYDPVCENQIDSGHYTSWFNKRNKFLQLNFTRIVTRIYSVIFIELEVMQALVLCMTPVLKSTQYEICTQITQQNSHSISHILGKVILLHSDWTVTV